MFVSTTESGITSRGNCILRTTLSLRTTEVEACSVAWEKNSNSRMLSSSIGA